MYFDNALAPRVTQAFPNINLFAPPNASEGSEKFSTPFVAQMRKWRSERVTQPTKVTWQASVLFNPRLPDRHSWNPHGGKGFRMFFILTWNWHQISFVSLLYAFQAMPPSTQSRSHPDFFRTMQIKEVNTERHAEAQNVLVASKYYLSHEERVGEVDLFV